MLSWTVGWLAYLIDYRGRATAHQNLKAAFARDHITDDQARAIALGSYQNFARTFLDLFWSVRLAPKDYAKIVQITWEDPETESLVRKRGSLWITPHFGNFEILSLLVGSRGFSFVTIAQDFKNAALTTVFARLRQGTGHQIIPQRGAMLRIVKELQRGGSASLLPDLTVKPTQSATVIECFGLKTCVTSLHTSLSSRLSLPLIPATCIPLDESTYRCRFMAPMEPTDYESPAAMAQAVWDRFEPQIRELPEGWLWMYKHWRFLPGTEEDGKYPAYANPNRQFRKLLERR